VVKIATFAKPQNVGVQWKKDTENASNPTNKSKFEP
jgi:hypothetical protein